VHARRDSEPNTVSQNLPKEAKILFFSKKPKRRQFSTHEKRNSGNQSLGADHYFFKYNPLHEFLFQWSTIFFPMRDFFAPTPTPPPITFLMVRPLFNGPFPNEQNFDLNKSRQTFHHSLKEHHKISNIPKFLCEMLQKADNIVLQSLPFFSNFVLRTRN
jgi:hypothetical protein